MKRFIGIWLLLPVIALAGDQIKPHRTRYPVVGLVRDELQQALSVVAEDISSEERVGFVKACTDSVLVSTLIIRNGESIPGGEIILKFEQCAWTILGRVETGQQRREVGVQVAELRSVVRALPPETLVQSLEVKTSTKITVNAGRIDGPLVGYGQYFEYEKRDGEWQETKRCGFII